MLLFYDIKSQLIVKKIYVEVQRQYQQQSQQQIYVEVQPVSIRKPWAKREHGRRKVRALTSHPNSLGSTPKPVVTCELSLLLVPVLTPRVLLRILRFSSLRKHHLFKFQLDVGIVDMNSHLVECPSLNLHTYADLLAGPVSAILNSSFHESRLPPSWKEADVVPVPKQRPINDINKHLRPISLTPILS